MPENNESLYETGEDLYWVFPAGTFEGEFEPTGQPLSSYKEARAAAESSTEAMDIWRTPAGGRKAEFVEMVQPAASAE
jgi:hypothetical protein